MMFGSSRERAERGRTFFSWCLSLKGTGQPQGCATRRGNGTPVRDRLETVCSEKEREQCHTYRLFLSSQKHVSLSNWTEISFSERKVTTPKMVQNGLVHGNPNTHCQSHTILGMSDIHRGVRALCWQRGCLSLTWHLLISLSNSNEQILILLKEFPVAYLKYPNFRHSKPLP